MTFYKSYPQPWPGYTVPEFGGRLNGLGDDAPDILPTSYPESTFTVEQLSGLGNWLSDRERALRIRSREDVRRVVA